jgi:hypothetical protein
MDWIELAQDMDRCPEFVNAVMNFVFYQCAEFLDQIKTS